MEEFMKYYEKYLAWFDRSKNVIPRDRYGKLLSVQLNFTTRNMMMFTTSNCGSMFINMYEAVYGELKPYLRDKQKTKYKKINWDRPVEEIIEDLFETENRKQECLKSK